MKNVINRQHTANVINVKRGFNNPRRFKGAVSNTRFYQDEEPDAAFYWKKFNGTMNLMFHLTMAKAASKAICA